jgi:GNAT superfamily N-acetyltransferase
MASALTALRTGSSSLPTTVTLRCALIKDRQPTDGFYRCRVTRSITNGNTIARAAQVTIIYLDLRTYQFRAEMTGMGLGVLLMRRIIDDAQSRGTNEMFGEVLRENSAMLKLCQVLGFARSTLPDEPDIIRVSLA